MEYVKLEEICTIVSGGTPSRSKPNYWNNGNIPWIKIKDMKSKYIASAEEFITEEGLNNSSTKMLKRDTILYSIFATLGEVGILKIDACTNQAIAGLSLKEDSNILKEYLYYYLKSKKKDVNNLGRGVAQNNINLSLLRKFRIPVIPLHQQEKIIGVLDNVSNTINNYEREIYLLDELVKARFVEMFGDPVTNPKGWETTSIGDVCYYIKDGPHKSLPDIGRDNGGHPFISVRNIVNGYIDFSDARYISDEDYYDSIKKCHPEKGDMLYSKGGTTGIAKLIDIDEPFANWVHVAVLKFDKFRLNGIFFENMLNGDYCYSQSQRLTKGIANRDLVLSAMAQIKLYCPPLELQNQFASFVQEIDKSRSRIQKSLETSQELFDSLMQEYFG